MNGNRNKGFTLIEMLIVVLILAIVLTVSYPSLSRGATTIHLRATSRDILNTLRYARTKAVTEQSRMVVMVDREKQELILTDGLGEGGRTYRLPKDVKIQRMAIAGTEVMEGPMLIRFLPNGSSDSAEILLKSDAESFVRIVSDPITGGARIEAGMGENQP
jgi:general secretion pathway protein H